MRLSPSDAHRIVHKPDVHHLLLAMLRIQARAVEKQMRLKLEAK